MRLHQGYRIAGGSLSVSCRSLPAAVRCCVAATLSISISSHAWAQVSGSVATVSDYRVRGASLSAGRPEPQINLVYDSARGWYAGAFASGVELDEDRNGGHTQFMAYAGYTGRLPSEWSWEAGATRSYFPRSTSYDYAEVFAGLGFDKFSSRLYFSPNYFGHNVRTIYIELNASFPIHEWLHFLGHIGFLQSHTIINAPAASTMGRFDTRLGFGATHANWNFQLSWVGVENNGGPFPYYGDQRPATWVAQISYFF